MVKASFSPAICAVRFRTFSSYISSNTRFVQLGQVLHHGGQLGVRGVPIAGQFTWRLLRIDTLLAFHIPVQIYFLEYLLTANLGRVSGRASSAKFLEKRFLIASSIPTTEEPAPPELGWISGKSSCWAKEVR